MLLTAGDYPRTATAGDSSSKRGNKSSEVRLSVSELKDYLEDWNLESQLRQHTPQSILSRKDRIGKFFWFLEHKNFQSVGVAELRAFFLYCAEGHLEQGGRWGNPTLTTPMRPISVQGYHRIIKAFFNYLVNEEILESSPLKRIKPPAARAEIKNPVSDEHVAKILKACRQSVYSRRDTAIVLLLLDTGLRASELCGLKMCDWDAPSHSLRVLGKGNKYRTAFLGLAATKAISSYLRNKSRPSDCPIFLSQKQVPLSASGLYQMMERLSLKAGVPNPGVHALRRTFAVNMLKAGANVFTVQMLMGHSTLDMTRRYCKVAEADCEEQHRKFSPADRIGTRGK